MTDIDLELRMQLMRVRPQLALSHSNDLIRGVASSCLDVRDDASACGQPEHEDFVTFCQVDGVALAAIFRKSEVEFFALAADEAFIRESEHLAMVEVQQFMQLARKHSQVPGQGLSVSMSQALPWMEQHRKAEKDGDSEHAA
jgi:hypothetical protein